MVVARLVRRTDFLTFSKRGLFKCERTLADACVLLPVRVQRVRA